MSGDSLGCRSGGGVSLACGWGPWVADKRHTQDTHVPLPPAASLGPGVHVLVEKWLGPGARPGPPVLCWVGISIHTNVRPFRPTATADLPGASGSAPFRGHSLRVCFIRVACDTARPLSSSHRESKTHAGNSQGWLEEGGVQGALGRGWSRPGRDIEDLLEERKEKGGSPESSVFYRCFVSILWVDTPV